MPKGLYKFATIRLNMGLNNVKKLQYLLASPHAMMDRQKKILLVSLSLSLLLLLFFGDFAVIVVVVIVSLRCQSQFQFLRQAANIVKTVTTQVAS